MRIYAILLSLLLAVGCAHLSGVSEKPGIDGKWEGTFSGGMGGQPMKLDYDFKSDGNKLTGTVVGGEDGRIEIQNGEIDGNNISFDVPVEMNNMKMIIAYTGVLSGDELELSFTVKMEGGPGGGMGAPPGGGQAPPNTFITKRVE